MARGAPGGGHNTEDLGGSKGVVLFLIRAMAAGEAQNAKSLLKMRDQPGFFLYVWTYADHG